jgi:hypothetical protein
MRSVVSAIESDIWKVKHGELRLEKLGEEIAFSRLHHTNPHSASHQVRVHKIHVFPSQDIKMKRENIRTLNTPKDKFSSPNTFLGTLAVLRSTAGLRFYVSRNLSAIAPGNECIMEHTLQVFAGWIVQDGKDGEDVKFEGIG